MASRGHVGAYSSPRPVSKLRTSELEAAAALMLSAKRPPPPRTQLEVPHAAEPDPLPATCAVAEDGVDTVVEMDGDTYRIDTSPLGLLGQGGQGAVRAAERASDGRTFAVKQAMRRTSGARELLREAAALRRLDHPNVIKIESFTADAPSRAHPVCIALELCEGGELFDEVLAVAEARESGAPSGEEEEEGGSANAGGLSFGRVRRYMRQLVSAVAHCHARGVCHRDIKAENILLTTDGSPAGSAAGSAGAQLRLIDFGLASIGPDGATEPADEEALAHTRCGSLMYAAPELLASHAALRPAAAAAPPPGAWRAYDARKVDVWSLGVVLYAMLTATLPFKCAHAEMCSRYASFLAGKSGRLFAGIPADALSLLRAMLQPEPQRRAHAAQLLAHPWLCGADDAHAPAPALLPTAAAAAAAAMASIERRPTCDSDSSAWAPAMPPAEAGMRTPSGTGCAHSPLRRAAGDVLLATLAAKRRREAECCSACALDPTRCACAKREGSWAGFASDPDLNHAKRACLAGGKAAPAAASAAGRASDGGRARGDASRPARA